MPATDDKIAMFGKLQSNLWCKDGGSGSLCKDDSYKAMGWITVVTMVVGGLAFIAAFFRCKYANAPKLVGGLGLAAVVLTLISFGLFWVSYKPDEQLKDPAHIDGLLSAKHAKWVAIATLVALVLTFLMLYLHMSNSCS